MYMTQYVDQNLEQPQICLTLNPTQSFTSRLLALSRRRTRRADDVIEAAALEQIVSDTVGR